MGPCHEPQRRDDRREDTEYRFNLDHYSVADEHIEAKAALKLHPFVDY